MAKETQKRRGRDPNRDVQPWLGWITALLIVIFVVVAVAMGMERTSNQRTPAATVAMTPLVGGMELAAVTPTPGEVAASGVVTVEVAATTAVTDTATDTVTASVDVAATGDLTMTEPVTATADVTAAAEVTAAVPVTESVAATSTLPTVEIVTATTTVTTTEVEAAETPISAPTPTAIPQRTVAPTAAPTPDARTFAPGDVVVSAGGRVAVYADALNGAALLDTYGAGVPLTVIEPSGDVGDYPVVVDGVSWLRVRAQDGLVGWVQSHTVVTQ